MLSTVLRTGQVLALFDAGHPERTLGEVAEALRLPRSTVHALLKTLCATGLLRRTPSRRYALGPRLCSLSARLAAAEPALAAAQRAVEELARSWGGLARVLVLDPVWGSVEVARASAPHADPADEGTHRCQAVVDAVAARGVPEGGCWCDLELHRPGWCCLAAAVRGSAGVLVLDLSLPAGRFYAHARQVRASLLAACGYPVARPVPLPAQLVLRRGQLAR
jgi:DNA-binding IclR family transcriptional regulator